MTGYYQWHDAEAFQTAGLKVYMQPGNSILEIYDAADKLLFYWVTTTKSWRPWNSKEWLQTPPGVGVKTFIKRKLWNSWSTDLDSE